MKIQSHETTTTICCQCETCNKETSFTYIEITEDEAYIQAYMETCPKCGNPGKDYLTACKEVFG